MVGTLLPRCKNAGNDGRRHGCTSAAAADPCLCHGWCSLAEARYSTRTRNHLNCVRSLVAWRGSAGAVRYSVERRSPGTQNWELICDDCATDFDAPWVDITGSAFGAEYRVTAYNLDGLASQPSQPR